MNGQNIYLDFLRRWYWLIALGMLAALIATNFALRDRQLLYQSTATVQVGRTLESTNPNQADLAIAESLLPSYSELARRDPVLNAAIEQLQLPLTADGVRARLHVTHVSGTQLIDIHVIDANPELAAALANEIARQLMLQSPSANQSDESQAFVKGQLADLQDKITQTQTEITKLEDEIPSMASASDIFEAQSRLEVLQAQVDTWQQTYASMLTQVEPSSANVVQVVNQAAPSSTPLPQRTMLYYALAAVLGAGLSALLALGLNELDQKIRDARDLRSLAQQAPVVTIPRYRMPRNGGPIVLDQPFADATRSYRVLRNMVETQVRNESQHATLAVTSSRLGEGKTTTAANLGVALANSGHQVILVDANIRNPQLEELFGLVPPSGFSDLISGEELLNNVIMPTDHANLRIIGAGSIPNNFHDLLASSRNAELVKNLQSEADFVLFDTPAVTEEHETQLLAKHLDGVLLVAESQRATLSDLQETLGVLEMAGVSVATLVLNKQRVPLWRRVVGRFSIEQRMLNRASDRRRRRQLEADSTPGATSSAD